MNRVNRKSFLGMDAIELETSLYTAVVIPEVGGNIVSFRQNQKAYRILREPSTREELLEAPTLFGMPVLFPPNRYDNGTFELQGRTYHFPVNEYEMNNHLHGFLYDIPWKVKETSFSDQGASVTLVQEVDRMHPMYAVFPHTFVFQLTYECSDEGLRQHILIHNTGEEAMPCMLGFHTAINVPFAPGSVKEDYACRISIGERWELDERMLPTGRLQKLSPSEERLKTTGIFPFFAPMDNHYTAEPHDGRNRMELVDRRERVKLIYDAGLQYKHWMVWNQHSSGTFFCPEPQIAMVNAPNVPLPSEATSLLLLKPNESWSGVSSLALEDVADTENTV